MQLNFEKENIMIPKWNSNDKFKKDQIKVYWKYPTYSERKSIKHFTNPKISNLKSNPEIEFIIDFEVAVKLCLIKIENLTVNDSNIITAKDLIGCVGLASLVDEIGGAIVAKMDEVKNNSKN